MANAVTGNEPDPNPPASSVTAAIQAPLFRLIAEYTAAQATIEKVLVALGPVAAAAGNPTASASASTIEPAAPAPAGETVVTVDVSSSNKQALIDFEDALSQIAGVQRVALKSLDDGQAVFGVTLSAACAAEDAAPGFSVVCSWCGRLLTLGGVRVSHGLCPECANEAAAGKAIKEIPAQASQVRAREDALIYLKRAGDTWVERQADGAGGWQDVPTPYPAETAAHVVLDHVSTQNPDRLVVVSGDGGATLAAGAVREPVPAR